MTWDPEGTPRLDFLAAFSAVNQGHCHPRLVAALQEQAGQLTLISRAFHSDRLGPYAKLLCETFGYQRMLPANSGVEAVRPWASGCAWPGAPGVGQGGPWLAVAGRARALWALANRAPLSAPLLPARSLANRSGRLP